MGRLHTTAAKAVQQIERRDARGAEQYRAELKYFHYKPRVVLGAPYDDPLIRQAALYGPECVNQMLALRGTMQQVKETLAAEADRAHA
jgi:hypothetical protein